MAGKAEKLSVAVVVAHPDDEALWTGGTLLLHPEWSAFVASLCRGSDPDRAPKFFRAIESLGAEGAMADLDDGPEQAPLPPAAVEETVLSLLPAREYDLLLTHQPKGEYTRHRRHEEVSRAVLSLLAAGKMCAGETWLFAYEDGGRAYPPRPEAGAPKRFALPREVWEEKYRLVTQVYGFGPDSWEALATPREEAFWPLGSAEEAAARLATGGAEKR